MKKILPLLIVAICSSAHSAQSQFLGISPGDKELNKQYCTKVVDVTQSTADGIASALQVSSDSVQPRRVWPVASYAGCCLTVDTPKGPYSLQVYSFYSVGKKVIAFMDISPYRKLESEFVCR